MGIATATSEAKPAVLHLIPSLHRGGSESQAVQLVRLLQGTGSYQVFVATLGNEGPLRTDVDRLGLAEVPEYGLTSFYDWNAARQLKRLVSYLREHRIAILQTHDFYTNIFGMAAGWLARVPVRIAARRESGGLRPRVKRAAEHLAYRAATRVVANCWAVAHQLIAEGLPPEKVVTIYNGLDLGRIQPSPMAGRDELLASLQLPFQPAQQFVTMVANLRLPVKDHPTFLRAAQKVAAVAPNAAFLIAGEGELMPSMKALAADLGMLDRTCFLGRCDRVPELLSISDVAVLSSTSEGFPNSILEYMAAGLPVVATDVGGIREMVVDGETGYIVKARDHIAMADRIVFLLSHPDLTQTMGERGRLLVAQKFSIAAQLQAAVTLYEGLLRRTGGGRNFSLALSSPPRQAEAPSSLARGVAEIQLVDSVGRERKVE